VADRVRRDGALIAGAGRRAAPRRAIRARRPADVLYLQNT
jgi:hypothetical protein